MLCILKNTIYFAAFRDGLKVVAPHLILTGYIEANFLLCSVLQLLLPTCMEYLHIRSNLPHGSHSEALASLYGLPQGATCSLAEHPTSSVTWPPLPHYQGLGCYPSWETPLDDPLQVTPVYWK